MNWRRLFVLACVIALGVVPVIAQDAQETARLQIEITRDGTFVFKPSLMLASGREGRVELDGQWAKDNPLIKGLREKIIVTPTIRGDDITLAFNIASGERQLRPSLVISKDVRGSVEWVAADGQPLRFTVSWVQ